MLKIIVSGGNSKFAKKLQSQNTDHTLILCSKHEMDITDINSINKALDIHNPDVFIHTAALSRPMVVHDTHPEKSISTNIIGTANCVLACMVRNIKFVYISTDFIYPGTQGNYSETDPVYPVNLYAWSKLGGECSCMLYKNSLILRSAMFDTPFPHDKAFTDSIKSCIWNDDAARITLQLINTNAIGIYNLGGDAKSIYDFVIQEKIAIFKESRNNVNEAVPSDISMNLSKLNNKLNDTTI